MGRCNRVGDHDEYCSRSWSPDQRATAEFWRSVNPIILVLYDIYKLCEPSLSYGGKGGAYEDGFWDLSDAIIDRIEEEEYLMDLLNEMDDYE